LFGETIHDHRNAIEVWQPPYVITMNWASRKSVLTQVGYFDENFMRCEDVDLAYRVFQAGLRIVFAPNAIVYHQNESTYSKLFHEGYLHGYYSVQALKKHRTLLQHFGHRRFQIESYAALFTSFKASLSSPRSAQARCEFIFNSGKKIGKLRGSLRFGYLDL
jgi:GT2 family glycosyltransferase